MLPVSTQEIDEAERLEKRVLNHPEVVEILDRHQNGWFIDTAGTPPAFNYGTSGRQYAGKDREGRDVIAPIPDAYTSAELDTIANAIAEEMRAMHFSRRVEFHDTLHNDHTTHVLLPTGEVRKP